MCTNKLEPIKTPIAVEIAFKLSQLDVTAIRIFLTEIGNATDNDTFELFVVCVPHCILVAFGGENYGEYARSLKRFSFIAIQHLRWLWTFLGISNSGITVFSSDLLETVVTTTKSQNI